MIKKIDPVLLLITLVLAIAIIGGRIYLLNDVNDSIDNEKITETSLNSTIVRNQSILKYIESDVDNVYELYDAVPDEYSYEEVYTYIEALYEEAGITQDTEYRRGITISVSTVSADTDFGKASSRFDTVQISLDFKMNDIQLLTDLITTIEDSEQLFIISELDYDYPPETNLGDDDDIYTNCDITFVAYYVEGSIETE